MNTIQVRSFAPPPIRRDEIIRYMGSRSAGASEMVLAEAAVEACRDKLQYKACYGVFSIAVSERDVSFPFMKVQSRALAKNLCGCDCAVLFAATVGLWPDRLVMRTVRTEPSKALAVQAFGAERIEALCDVLQEALRCEFKAQGFALRPRFSPGYGDFDIAAQRDIFRVLDCSRKIGLTLNDSMLMSPSKSVTAVIGLSRGEAATPLVRCAVCTQQNCAYRREKDAD